MEQTHCIDDVARDFFYLLAHEKRAITFLHAPDEQPRSRAQIFRDMQTAFRRLPKQFYPSPQSLGSLLATLDSKTEGLVDVVEIPKKHKSSYTNVAHYSHSEFGHASMPFIAFGLEVVLELNVTLAGILGDIVGNAQHSTVEKRITLLSKLNETGELHIDDIQDALEVKLGYALRHAKHLEEQGLVAIKGARLKGDDHQRSYFVSANPNGHVAPNIPDIVSAQTMQAFLDHYSAHDVGDYLDRSVLFAFKRAPKCSRSRQPMVRYLIEHGFMEVHSNNNARVELLEKGREVVEQLIHPIQRALSGDGESQAKILDYSAEHNKHPKVSVYKIARSLN